MKTAVSAEQEQPKKKPPSNQRSNNPLLWLTWEQEDAAVTLPGCPKIRWSLSLESLCSEKRQMTLQLSPEMFRVSLQPPCSTRQLYLFKKTTSQKCVINTTSCCRWSYNSLCKLGLLIPLFGLGNKCKLKTHINVWRFSCGPKLPQQLLWVAHRAPPLLQQPHRNMDCSSSTFTSHPQQQ